MTIGDQSPDVVFGHRDGVVRLSELWADGPLVLAFLRHFGWPFCREYLVALREGAGDIAAAGGRIAAVTQGNPEQAQALCDRFGVTFPCLADADRDSYRAFGLERGSALEVVGPKAILGGLRAARKGHFVERTIGDVFQMPGTFVLDAGGIVRYARYARSSGDHPRIAELVEVLDGLAIP